MPTPLHGRHIALGVTGSIAAYKALDLASKLIQANASVVAMLTGGATRFVSPLAFAAITHRPAVTDLYDPQSELGIDHVALAERADLVIVAPATANTLAKMAHGLADDPVTTTLLATAAPVLVAPAMDAHMFDHPATRANLALLKERGVYVAGPLSGRMASGLTGTGRMVEPVDLVGHARLILGLTGDLAGRSVVVTAGGTEEAIDPVRVITNHSSGKMGYAIAEAARDRGALVTLVAARSALADPVGVSVVRVTSAADMGSAVARAVKNADALVMSAAVSDWTPANVSASKAKKTEADSATLELKKTEDILASIKQPGLVKVGFAAETEDLERNARAKLGSKGLDFVVANDVASPDSGFGSDNNTVTLVGPGDKTEALPSMAKYEVGHRILDRVAAILAGRG
jgi:phosphopantothenoylcysteine decarboxylase / phosphopantothenate---cysteine ligase